MRVVTLVRAGALRVVIYVNDHRPAHVHVIGPGNEAVFILNCPGGPSSLRSSRGFTGQALRAVEVALKWRTGEAVRRLGEISCH